MCAAARQAEVCASHLITTASSPDSFREGCIKISTAALVWVNKRGARIITQNSVLRREAAGLGAWCWQKVNGRICRRRFWAFALSGTFCAVDLFTSRKCARVFAFCARAASPLSTEREQGLVCVSHSVA
jgi:hypothetical protein